MDEVIDRVPGVAGVRRENQLYFYVNYRDNASRHAYHTYTKGSVSQEKPKHPRITAQRQRDADAGNINAIYRKI